MKRLAGGLLSIVFLMSAAMGQQANRAMSSRGTAGQAALEQAAAANKFAFIFFWKDRNPQTDKAWATLQPLAAKIADAAVVAAVQVTDPEEKQLVTHYGVDRAPLPLVLAIAPCGAVTKAITANSMRSSCRRRL